MDNDTLDSGLEEDGGNCRKASLLGSSHFQFCLLHSAFNTSGG
jgi:hypothetical protein